MRLKREHFNNLRDLISRPTEFSNYLEKHQMDLFIDTERSKAVLEEFLGRVKLKLGMEYPVKIANQTGRMIYIEFYDFTEELQSEIYSLKSFEVTRDLDKIKDGVCYAYKLMMI